MTWTFLNIVSLDTDLPKPVLQAFAASLGLGEDVPSVLSCKPFQDLIHGQMMRHIGQIYYSPRYTPKRGGPWRIKYFTDVTPSDELVLLHAACSYMRRGPGATDDWVERPFNDPTLGTYRGIGICRPLSDYTGDELFTMVTLPEPLPLTHHETAPLGEVSR